MRKMRYIFIFIFLFSFAFTNDIALSTKKTPSLEEILPTIKGINLICDNDKNYRKKEGIDYFCLDIPNGKVLTKTLKPFLGKFVSMENFYEIEDVIRTHFIKEDFLFTVVYAIPDQNITDGIIVVKIVKATAGSIKAVGAKYFNNKRIQKKLKLFPGHEIDFKATQKKLATLNNSPYRNTKIYYKEGKRSAETDIIISTEDVFPARVYGGYDFTGYNVAGEARFFVGANVSSLILLDTELSYQYMFNPDINKWQGHTGSINIPIFADTILKTYGYYIETKPDLALKSSGRSWMLAGKYHIPIITTNLRSSIFCGFEFKRTNNFLNYISPTSTYPQPEEERFVEVDIAQFQFGYEGVAEDRLGQTAFQLYLFYSPGDLTKLNKNEFFNLQRPGAKSDYIYSYATIDRVTNIISDFRWMLSLKGQLSSVKLMPSEEFSLGGAHTIRGYNENTLIGDNGYYIKNELRTPRIGFIKDNKDQLELLAFLDYGDLWDADETLAYTVSSHLVSAGAGIRYNIEEILTLRCDYGYQLKRAVSNKDKRGRFHIGVVLSY